MATYSSVLPTFAATTAGLKDIMNTTATLLTNAGFAKSTETGEIDIDAVTYNSTSGTTYGFQVWYLNDSLHATYPIYIRIYWRMSSTNTLGLAYTIGHATDGAGNITGYKNGSDTTYLYSGTTWGTTGNASKACSLSGYGFLSICPNPTSALPVILFLTREWDKDTGAIASTGNYTLIYRSGTSAFTQVSVNRADSLTSTTNALHGAAPGGRTTSLRGAYTDIFKLYQNFPNVGYRTHGAACMYNNTEITLWATFPANILGGGSARTWLAMGSGYLVSTTDTDHVLAVLWE